MTEKPAGARTHCIRCGTCCMKGGPTLHKEDAALIEKGVLKKTHLYTLRKGEVVRNIDDTLTTLKGEIVKIKGTGKAWTCLFYDQEKNACMIYAYRPAECRALKCWDLQEFKDAMDRPPLQRADLIRHDDGLLKLIDAHEQRCSYEILDSAVKALQGSHGEGAAEKILDLLQYDAYMRPLLTEKLDLDPDLFDFFFGRPLAVTIRMFGLTLEKQGDSLVLVPTDVKP